MIRSYIITSNLLCRVNSLIDYKGWFSSVTKTRLKPCKICTQARFVHDTCHEIMTCSVMNSKKKPYTFYTVYTIPETNSGPHAFHKSQHYWTSPRHAYLQKGTHNTRGGPTCMHESLQVQCIDQDIITWPQWHQCTVLVVIHARMSDLLWHNTQCRWKLHVVLWLLHSL